MDACQRQPATVDPEFKNYFYYKRSKNHPSSSIVWGMEEFSTCSLIRKAPLQDSTAIKFQPLNPKRVGTASYTRYERYKVAKTVGEARTAGAHSMDLKVDIEKGFARMK